MKSDQGITLPAEYRPSLEDGYMSTLHLNYFKTKLLHQRAAFLEETRNALHQIQSLPPDVGDEADIANRFNEIGWVIEGQERVRRALSDIDRALKRIESGEYGYCEESGEEIGLDRLEVNPTATCTVTVQEYRECCCYRDLRGGPGRFPQSLGR